MNRSAFVGLVGAASIVVIGVVYWASLQAHSPRLNNPTAPAVIEKRGDASSSVRSTDQSKSTITQVTSQQIDDYSALDYVQLRARVASDNSPGRQYVAAYVTESCSRFAEAKAAGRLVVASNAPATGPRNAGAQSLARERLRARSDAKRCAQWRTIVDAAEIRRMYESAAAEGDARARVWLLNADLRSTAVAPRTVRTSADVATPDVVQPATLTPAALSTLTDALSSRDPAAIRMAGELLFTAYRDGELRYGYTPGMMLDGVNSSAVWDLLACEYGADCGQQSTYLSERCAYEGRCDVDTIRDYLIKYELNPAQAAEVQAIVARFRAGIETGDWSFLTFIPVAPTDRRHWVFLPRNPAPISPIR